MLTTYKPCNFYHAIIRATFKKYSKVHENYFPETLIRTDQNEDIKGYSIKLTFPTDSGNFRCRQDFNFRISDMQHFNFRCRLPLVFE